MATAKVEFHVHRIDVFIKKLAAVGGGAPKYLNDVLRRCMEVDVYPLWVKQISLTDHTLEDLAALGHPYSTRYGKDSFVHPDEVVHIQDGNLLGGSRIESADREIGYKLVNDTPEYVFLRYGTAHMRMRDPGGAAMRDALPAIRRRFAQEVKGAIVEIVAKS